jgi:hypothetical protein
LQDDGVTSFTEQKWRPNGIDDIGHMPEEKLRSRVFVSMHCNVKTN